VNSRQVPVVAAGFWKGHRITPFQKEIKVFDAVL